MDRFIKEKTMKEATTVYKILQVPFDQTSEHKDASKVEIGFAAEAALSKLKSQKKISERQVLEIKMDCMSFLIALLKKFIDKSPVQYPLVRSMQCLDPRKMVANKELCVTKMKRVLQTLVSANQVQESVCDDVLREYRAFCEFALVTPGFRDFNPTSDRVDTLFHETMGSTTEYKRLWEVVKVLLVMSHGQASVERGFSINKEVEVENLKQQSLVGQRVIIDHIRAVGGVCKVQITKELLISAAGARQKYVAYLDEQKRERSRTMLAMKRKTLMDELGELKKKES